jgi:hypothetical protein
METDDANDAKWASPSSDLPPEDVGDRPEIMHPAGPYVLRVRFQYYKGDSMSSGPCVDFDESATLGKTTAEKHQCFFH